MTNSKLVPRRRFKEFELDGDWEFSRFGEAVVRVSESMKNSSFPNVEYEDVIPGRGKLNKNIFEKTNNKKGIRFLEGDVLYGKLRPYLKNWLLSDFKGIAVGDWWVLRSSGLDSKFLYNFIQTEKYQVVANRSTGTKMPRSDWETVKDSDIFFPSNFEQKQIGNFFQTIDSLITLHQHKLDKLINLKMAYLSEMFPAEGERVPKRRFPGFEGEWEQKKLGEILETVSFKEFMKEPQSSGDFEVIQQGHDSIIGFADGIPCNDFEDVVIFGDHTLSLYKPKNPFFVATDGVRILKGKNSMNGYYLYVLLDRFKPKSEGYKRYFGILTNVELSITYNIAEQEKIALLFQQIDKSIELQQQKLDKLNDLKKAYLNELFV